MCVGDKFIRCSKVFYFYLGFRVPEIIAGLTLGLKDTSLSNSSTAN